MFKQKKFKDIKSLINLAIVRVNTVRKKADQELGVKKRLLAKHLQESEYALARLEAERVVKLDWKVESMNILEIKLEEVRDNVKLLQNDKVVPPDLEEAVATVIYAELRADIPELKEVVRLLKRKYGEELIKAHVDNESKKVEERFIHRLSGSRPNAFLVYSYMKEIAAAFGIEFIDDDVTRALGERFDVPMTAGTAGVSSASGIGSAAYAWTDGKILPPGEKPPGFVPPSMFDNSDFPEGSEGQGGGNEGHAPAPKKKPATQAKKPAPKKPAPAAAKPKPAATTAAAAATPAPVPKKEDTGLSSLQDRFNKLQDL